MSVGPVLHPDDAVANKMSALYGRAFSRDFIDIDATQRSGRYSGEDLLRLAERADSGFDRRIFAAALGQASRLDPADFAQYGITGQNLHEVRDRFPSERLREARSRPAVDGLSRYESHSGTVTRERQSNGCPGPLAARGDTDRNPGRHRGPTPASNIAAACGRICSRRARACGPTPPLGSTSLAGWRAENLSAGAVRG